MFKKISSKIYVATIDNPKTPKSKVDWVNIFDASKKEVEYLRKKYHFEISHLQASTAKTTSQRPIIHSTDTYTFMILHFPVIKGDKIVASEIDFYIGHGFLVTIHDRQIETLNTFFNTCKKNSNDLISYEFESSAVLLYEILERLIYESYQILDHNSIKIDKVEDIIYAEKHKSASSQILIMRRNILNLRKIIQNHKNILKKLTELKSSLVPRNTLKDYYFILIENSKRIWELTEIQKEIIDAMHDTNQSMLNYKISNVMKILTIFSVIVFPVTWIAALFGMNIAGGMPLINHPHGFWVLLGIMMLCSIIMIIYFRIKKWF
jgi:magnesium transporter